MRLTRNPGESFTSTAVFPIFAASPAAVEIDTSSLCSVRTTSTSGIFGTGLKKCSPTTRPGYVVAAAISVTLSELVLVASTQSARTRRSSLANTSRFSGIFSNTASMTMSARCKPVHWVDGHHPIHGVFSLKRRQSAAFDLIIKMLRYAHQRRRDGLGVYLNQPNLNSCTGQSEYDARAHGAATDDGGIFYFRRPGVDLIGDGLFRTLAKEENPDEIIRRVGLHQVDKGTPLRCETGRGILFPTGFYHFDEPKRRGIVSASLFDRFVAGHLENLVTGEADRADRALG